MIIDYFKKISKDTVYYGLGQSLRRFFSIFTAPILTRVFSPSDFGVIDLIITTIAFLTLFLSLSVNNGIFREYFDYTDSEKKEVLFSGISFIMILVIAVDLLLIIFAKQISIILFKSPEYKSIIILALLKIPIFILFDHFMTLLRFLRRAKLFVVFSIIQMGIHILFLLFYVVYLKLGITGVFLTAISSNLFPLIFLSFLIAKYYSPNLKMGYVKNILAFSLPLLPGLFINMYLMNANRYFMNAYSSLEQIGIYSIATKIASISSIAALSFGMAWNPYAYSIINQKDKHFLYDKIFRFFFGMAAVIVFSVYLFANDILIILTTERYFVAYSLVGFICLGKIMYNVNTMISLGILISKKTYLMTIAQLGGAVAATLSFFLLIPKYNALGAAMSLLIGYSISSIFIYILSQRVYKINYKSINIILIYFCTLISIIVYYFFADLSNEVSISNILFKIIYIFLFAFIVFNIAFIKEEKMKFITLLKLKIKDNLLLLKERS